MPSLYHIGLTVENLEESVAFYRDVVGLEEIPSSSDLDISGEWFDQLTENHGAKLRVSHLDLEGVQLQLVEYRAAGGERLPLHHKMIGNPHLCINKTQINEHHAKLVADGRFKTSPIVTIGETSIRSFYVTDPNGVLVEFIEGTQSEGSTA